ncbi:hypothetical protein [Ureibacillus chungkukjangi]|nr:hypothetical protein [Ureibacillus chungkukjangi]
MEADVLKQVCELLDINNDSKAEDVIINIIPFKVKKKSISLANF